MGVARNGFSWAGSNPLSSNNQYKVKRFLKTYFILYNTKGTIDFKEQYDDYKFLAEKLQSQKAILIENVFWKYVTYII